MNKINDDLVILITNNLIIKDIIKLCKINKKYSDFIKNNYNYYFNKYFPLYKEIYKYKDFNELININYNNKFEPKFKKIKEVDYNKIIEKLNEKKIESFERIKNKDITDKKKEQLYKTYETKLSKKIDNLGKIIKSRKISFEITENNKNIIFEIDK